MSGFQKSVNLNNPLAVAGDFASANPRASAVAGEGTLVAGAGGVTVGLFAWIQADGTVLNVGGAGVAPDGIIHREENALITGYLAEASNVIPAGFPVTVMKAGDFFLTVTGATAATRGAEISAVSATGAAVIGAPGAGQVATKFTAQSACAVGELVKASTW